MGIAEEVGLLSEFFTLTENIGAAGFGGVAQGNDESNAVCYSKPNREWKFFYGYCGDSEERRFDRWDSLEVLTPNQCKMKCARAGNRCKGVV